MASIIEINGKHRAQVRRAGQPTLTKTFDTPKEAKQWAAAQEVAIDSGKKVGVHGRTGITLETAIDRYLVEEKDLGKTSVDILGYLKIGMGKIVISKMTSNDIFVYIRDKNFGPMSGAMHFSYLRSVLNMAKVIWEFHVPDIIDEAREKLTMKKLIGLSQERDRRPTKKEIEMLLTYDFPGKLPMADIIRFAMSTAMRQAEITRIEWGTFDREHKTVVITDRKHPKKKKGNHQTVPLLDESIEIMDQQQKKEFDSRIFPFNPSTVGTYFTNACRALGIEDLHFHDLRHEGASRLFEMGYQIHEVAKFTGHEDWKMLQRYTHLKSKDIRRLDEKKTEPTPVPGPVGMDEETLKEFEQFLKMKKMMEIMKQQEAA